jgi:eukaryotic-like serine/threonine-protein kinase
MRAPSEVAGRYRIERRLGAGGMSTVFLALDTVLERHVAVKLLAEHLADDEAFVARFRREALAAARLQHPNIVQVFDSGQDEESGRHYIVMEYVPGSSCAELLREHKLLEVDEAVALVRDACHGLDYAHRAGVVHRDVKPGNLLVSEETGTAKLADFGIAKAGDGTRITQTGSVLGTAAYLSPEQAHGEEATPVSDIYSLGVCAYQFLAGRLPHEYGSLTELALKQHQEPVTPIVELRPEVPAELDRAIRVALASDPRDRYERALDFAEAVVAGLHGDATEATMHLDDQGTQALAPDEDETYATMALPADQVADRAVRPPPPPARRREPLAPRRPLEPEPEPAGRRGTPRWLTNLLILLALLAAGGAVAYALLASETGGGVDPVVEDTVREQIQKLEDLIVENTE